MARRVVVHHELLAAAGDGGMLSVEDVATMAGVSMRTVLRRMRQEGVPVRRQGQRGPDRRPRKGSTRIEETITIRHNHWLTL
jgi:hypothetical protein